MHRPLIPIAYSFCVLVLFAGCGAAEHEPVDREVATGIKSSSALADAEAALGPPHAPSSAQQRAIAKVLERMPEAIRKNAERDKTLAWGNDRAFLVVKVNDEGTIWVTATHFGSERPQRDQ